MTDDVQPALEDIQPAPVLDDGSLRGRLAARRTELRDHKPFDLPVPGYEGILVARYHSLDYKVVRAIGLRQKDNSNQADSELKIAADTLLHACDGLFEVLENGDLRDTGFKWTVDAARNLFGIGPDEVPDEATSRVALMAMIPDSTSIVLHYGKYDARSRSVDDEVAEEISGESVAVLEAA